ncbi:MAG: insulinase family protein [Hyphomicrobiales bacterium]|uniref:M16 family metallopeptidase n=1 Tax=Rhabdaerophilum calidifontis TaxID=2604328 RepID=UPI001FE71197|nr:pitrilysin family protein [Rhabdaerophilum calidifontis]MCA1952193.1 insulinase family protein [Hyphomicrobiales bacterium]MCA1998247.1 insulinase family protein [Hyphomicrobiales bacterium]
MPKPAPVDHLRLANGMEVVVIPDRRAPVVTHMVYFRNGAADDPPGKSGIAHFLEHLMFKGTKMHPKGAFSEIVAALGGQENAFTSYDYTAYFQRVAREHLGRMMALEADRMVHLVLEGPEVDSERDVVIEERKMRTDADPAAQLQESLLATLYVHHPYGTPVIGWGHEIEGLGREDALAYYRRFYRPDNAILIVAGDVETAEVLRLAEETYGRLKPGDAEPPRRARVREPEIRASRHVRLADAKVEQPTAQRAYIVPSHATAEGGEAFALEVLSQLLGGSATSRLYRSLVLERGLAVSTGAWYWNDALDMGQFGTYAVPAEGVDLDALDSATEAVLARLREEPVGAAELERAKTRLIADMIYAQDNQAHLARIYGSTLTTGGAVEDVLAWPERIRAVTAAEVQAVAVKYLQPGRVVTGHLVKAAA